MSGTMDQSPNFSTPLIKVDTVQARQCPLKTLLPMDKPISLSFQDVQLADLRGKV